MSTPPTAREQQVLAEVLRAIRSIRHGHVQVVVQKCVVLSPTIEHNVAIWLPRQSSSVVQNLPTPLSLPVSPGCPHADVKASIIFASGLDGDLLLLHAAATASAMTRMMLIRFRMPTSAGTIAHAYGQVNGQSRGVRRSNQRCKPGHRLVS